MTINPIPAVTPHLKQLRPAGILDSLEARNRQAIEAKLAYTEFLALLIDDEVARREQKKSFDTGGTVLDWHGGIVKTLIRVAEAQGLNADWHAVTNDWRRRTMKAIVGQMQPDFNMDDVHRRTLDESLYHFGLQAASAEQRHLIWRSWHELDAWADFPAALRSLRFALPAVSFTMLPTALVVDVSRKNGLVWDAVISCEMIGVYKPHPDAYTKAAKWLALAPAQILMVACHNFDLNAAHRAGFRTAFVRRPAEWGPEGPPSRTRTWRTTSSWMVSKVLFAASCRAAEAGTRAVTSVYPLLIHAPVARFEQT